MTSCETDQEIARRLTGVDWEGDLRTYYVNRWGEAFRDGDYRTVWRFEADYYDRYGEATHGRGEECDYDYRDRRNRAYSSFRWEVRNGNIYIYYDDRTWNDVRIDWRDYSISYSHFHGTMYDCSTATPAGVGTTTVTTAITMTGHGAGAHAVLTEMPRTPPMSTSVKKARASPQVPLPRHSTRWQQRNNVHSHA